MKNKTLLYTLFFLSFFSNTNSNGNIRKKKIIHCLEIAVGVGAIAAGQCSFNFSNRLLTQIEQAIPNMAAREASGSGPHIFTHQHKIEKVHVGKKVQKGMFNIMFISGGVLIIHGLYKLRKLYNQKSDQSG